MKQIYARRGEDARGGLIPKPISRFHRLATAQPYVASRDEVSAQLEAPGDGRIYRARTLHPTPDEAADEIPVNAAAGLPLGDGGR